MLSNTVDFLYQNLLLSHKKTSNNVTMAAINTHHSSARSENICQSLHSQVNYQRLWIRWLRSQVSEDKT